MVVLSENPTRFSVANLKLCVLIVSRARPVINAASTTLTSGAGSVVENKAIVDASE
jgi:hypothetical protein